MKCKMDDFDSGILSQAKTEYASRLVSILCPLILEGIKSIFTEALNMCKENEEEDKYLMTFQNFLSRIIKWNTEIIANETKRIVQKSGCNYLDDLLTCVHIAQLKILTSVRVGQKQKKIDIDIPKLNSFIHKVYIFLARKIYKNVYLYEKHITPLQYQKNMREAEIMCKESILGVIRDSVPVEKILRAYIDETVDEEIIQETSEIITSDVSDNVVTTEEVDKVDKDKTEKIIIKKDETKNDETKKKDETTTDNKKEENIINTISTDVKKELENNNSTKNEPLSLPEKSVKESETTTKVENKPSDDKKTEISVNVETEAVPQSIEQPLSPKSRAKLSFNNTDSVLDMGTNKIANIEAPKDIPRLEQLSHIRNEQRKLEDIDDEEDKLIIGRDVNLNNDILGIETIGNSIKLNEPILDNIEELK